MNKSSTTLSPGWHLPAVFVLTISVAMPFMSIYLPHAARLAATGHSTMAGYFNMVGVLNIFIALLILIPRRRNNSGFLLVRRLGQINLLLRYFIAFGVAAGLFWFGILLERIFTA